MKLNVNFSALWIQVNKISKTKVYIDLEKLASLDPITTTAGLEIPIEEIEFIPLATYRGQQVILFIPDHSFRNLFNETLNNPSKGNKFHLVDCSTLEDMRSRNRYRRYYATTNLSGKFVISSGDGRNAEVCLQVCQNCLKKLNYKNFNKNKNEVLKNFNLSDFFNYYKTSFRNLPNTDNLLPEEAGTYANNWRQISLEYRERKKWICELCKLNMVDYKNLLDVHHRNGNKRDNSIFNLQALCRECHSKQDMHDHIKLSIEEKQIFNKLRSEN